MYGLLGSGDIWLRYNYLKIWNLRVQKNLNVEKIIFKVVQMKFLAMHITDQELHFDIFRVGNVQNIFMEHDLNDFWNKIKINNFDPYSVFLALQKTDLRLVLCSRVILWANVFFRSCVSH